MTGPTTAQQGFTLAETLVALFILAIVSSAGAALLISATAASQQVREREIEARTLDIAQALIRQDIAALSDRTVQTSDQFTPPSNLYGEAPRGEEPFLRFVRNGWLNPGSVEGRGTLQSVAYSLRGGALSREATLRPDATNGTPVSQRVLLEDVARIELGFERADQLGYGEEPHDQGHEAHAVPQLRDPQRKAGQAPAAVGAYEADAGADQDERDRRERRAGRDRGRGEKAQSDDPGEASGRDQKRDLRDGRRGDGDEAGRDQAGDERGQRRDADGRSGPPLECETMTVERGDDAGCLAG